MLSKAHSTQEWLSQFLPEHHHLAELLLDSLYVITTEDMLNDLKIFILEIATSNSEKSALLPIRELAAEEYIYEDKNTSPVLQESSESLGSEAFISNLYTELNRARPRQFLQQKLSTNSRRKFSPSISFMKEHKFKHLFLVDDIIGSGDRAVSYLQALFSNKTINSWLSYGYINVHIIVFMATEQGRKNINTMIRKKKMYIFT